jgi:diguanylate cyclase (GGDEF)-like protein
MTEEVTKANEIISTLTQQVKILEEKTNLDPLTKVFNRRALNHYLQTVCSSQNTKFELHLLILDLDDFKNINDRYGHLAGDKVLIFIANILKKTLREGDKVFRYGGEEFVIILNRIDDVLCKKIARRLLDLVESNNLIYKGESLKVTMSMGGTKYLASDTPDSLLSRADAALYKAKSNGKNQFYTE